MNKKDCQLETRKHIDEVRKLLNIIIVELIKRGQIHDRSKLESPELEVFARHTSKLSDSTYGSKEYNDTLKKMDKALKHHYSQNQHHPEFHEGKHQIENMTLIDLLEMLCDWIASSLRHKDGDILRSIEQNQKRFGYSDELKNILIKTAKYIKTVI